MKKATPWSASLRASPEENWEEASSINDTTL